MTNLDNLPLTNKEMGDLARTFMLLASGFQPIVTNDGEITNRKEFARICRMISALSIDLK